MENSGDDDAAKTPQSSDGAPPPDEPSQEPVAAEEQTPVTAEEQAPAGAPGHSIARFLYTQNPFYLISCLLIIYGCQSLAVAQGAAIVKAAAMTGGLAAYALLMALVCIIVVRVCQVWQDSRSIFLVVLISLVAMTTGFDELCIGDFSSASVFTAAAGMLIVVVIESLRRYCRLRLGFWYSAALYTHFAVLIAFPLWLGNAVAERNDALANWGSVIFSFAIALSFLLLIPAVRRGPDSTKENGTPWNWPLYPLAAFFVLLVLAGIRTHAIWMSFGFFGVAGKFEPFLLLPLGAVVLVLIAECGLGQKNTGLQSLAVLASPLLLLCGLGNEGMTWLPIREDLRFILGSSWTASLMMLLALHAWLALRRVPLARFGVPLVLFCASATAPLPESHEIIGLQSWMIAAAGCVALLVITLREVNNDWLWTGFAAASAVTIAIMFEHYDQRVTGILVASVFAVTSMLVIGAIFDTDLAIVHRHAAALAMIIGSCVGLFRVFEGQREWVLLATASSLVVSLGYAWAVRRKGWFYVAGIHALALAVMIGWTSRRSNHWRVVNWPIASGIVCLGVGLAITSTKTGMYQRITLRREEKEPQFLPGL